MGQQNPFIFRRETNWPPESKEETLPLKKKKITKRQIDSSRSFLESLKSLLTW